MKFFNGCPNAATCRNYQDAVNLYMKYLKIDDPNQLLEGKPELLEDKIMSFIHDQKRQKLSGDLISQRIAAIKKFYKKNRMSKLLDWEYIREDVGDVKRKVGRNSGGDAYSQEQILAMRKIADEREAAVLSLYATSGIRRGVAPALSWKDLRPIDQYDIFEITGYRGYEEEYRTWCIPEARHDLEAYKRFRERYGEVFGPETPVIRDKFDINDPLGAKYPYRIGEGGIYNILSQLAERAGVRKRVQLLEGERSGKIRHEVKAVHGLRKFFDTQCTNSGVSPLWVEFFEGRQLMGSKGRYYRPSDQQLLEGINETKMRGYIHCIDALTINPENRLQVKVEHLQQENSKINSMLNRMNKMEEEMIVNKYKTAVLEEQWNQKVKATTETTTAGTAAVSPSVPSSSPEKE